MCFTHGGIEDGDKTRGRWEGRRKTTGEVRRKAMKAAGGIMTLAGAFAAAVTAAGCCALGPFHPCIPCPAPVPERERPVPLLSDEQKAYLDLPREERIAKFRDPEFRKEMKALGDKPLRVERPAPAIAGATSTVWRLVWEDTSGPIRLRQDMGVVSNGVAEISNLMVGWKYVLAFDAMLATNDAVVSVYETLATEDRAPRLLDIPGIPNARDFGGWRGRGGRRIRQGRIIRSAGLNENATPKDNPDTPGATRVTDATRAVLVGQLGVKTDVDLRWDKEVFGMTGSPLGPEVRWVRCPWSLYQWVAGDEEKAMFAKIFRLLLDRQNLPAVVHCIEGQDRTGTLCFLLQGLLGVSDEDKLRDWECTGFANAHWGFRHESRLDPFLKYLATLPGETVNDRCVSYARSCGVTAAEIALWRELMLEP